MYRAALSQASGIVPKPLVFHAAPTTDCPGVLPTNPQDHLVFAPSISASARNGSVTWTMQPPRGSLLVSSRCAAP
jgi:hypothetical protein